MSVQKHENVGRSIDAIMSFDGATLVHFYEIIVGGWIVTIIEDNIDNKDIEEVVLA